MSARKRKYTRRKGIFSSLKYEKNIDIDLSPDTTREIIGFLLIGTSLVFLLFSLGFAGKVGVVLYDIFQMLIGWSTISLPFILFYVGLSFIKPEKFEIRPSTIIGIIIFVVSLSALVHLLFALGSSLDEARQGAGGGYLGYGMVYVFNNLFGFWASLVIFVSAMISSVLITFNTTTAKIAEFIREFREDKEREAKVVVNSPEDFETSKRPVPEIREKGENISEVEFSSTPLISSTDKNWKLPPLELLSEMSTKPDSGDINENVKIIEKTLENFGVHVEMEDVNVGPTVTQYTLKPETGVKLNKITNLNNDLSLALAAHPIRIEAPIPGKALVGIEVPNKSIAKVRMRKLIEDEQFQKKRKSNLTIVLGRDVSGATAYANLDSMPHLLIAGSTGSGKSVCINTILLSLLYQNSPRDLKLILVDPKQVELTAYNGIPHLLTSTITEPEKAVNALKWAVSEMENRYNLLSQKGKKDIHSYNETFKKERLPYIVIVIDELAELMMTTAQEIESSIVRIAQKARATGIHLVVATQRPEANVVTGLIKANIPTKIAFAVSNAINSRIIIDSTGAEKLLGRGDMLYQASDVGKPRRIQGALVDESEISGVVDFVREQENVEYDEKVTEKHTDSSFVGMGSDEDPLLMQAMETIVSAQRASATILQSRLRIGYARAAHILDLLEDKGVIGPHEGSKAREVYIKDLDELERLKKGSSAEDDSAENFEESEV